MTADEPLFLWRIAADLTVEDAAILVSGNDPSAMDGPIIDNEIFLPHKRTTGHPGFLAALAGLKSAINRGQLRCHRHYIPHVDPDRFIISRNEIAKLPDPDDPLDVRHGDFKKEKFIDWKASTVDVEDLREWLKAKGFSRGFFFPASQGEPDAFTDKSHEHFSPELALAVAVWRGLVQTQKFPRGPKAAIEAWIEKHPEEWRGEGALSTAANERIITLVNWKRSGGAPPSGG